VLEGLGFKESGIVDILVTGSNGFLGKNLIARINATAVGNVLAFDLPDSEETLEEYIKRADFIFHLAGINRPDDKAKFYEGNSGLTETVIKLLEANNLKTPIVFSSTAQVGNGSDYGSSKEMAEKALREWQERSGSDVFIYRFPGIFGKWSRPNYNTVVATFCNNITRRLPITVRDPNYEVTLCYVDDVVDLLLKTKSERKLQKIKPLYVTTLGKLAALVESFALEESKLNVGNLSDSFTKKMYATYLSFLPEEKVSYELTTHKDDRGSFTEFLHLPKHGQVSINISKPGITKGDHWHDTKHEKFLVVSGCGVIRQRMLGSAEIIEHHVSSEKLEVVDILPGYTHNISNLGDTDMVTVMWVSEIFDKERPDTYFEKV
jgi:UDP-2-acetamido-2,6-beta-L-arabino-hexul-4-ose reductase